MSDLRIGIVRAVECTGHGVTISTITVTLLTCASDAVVISWWRWGWWRWHLRWWQWRWCWWWFMHWLWGNIESDSSWEKDGHLSERDESHRGKWEWLKTVQLTRDHPVTTIILYQSSSSRRMLCKALHCSPFHCFVTALKNTKMYFTEYTDVQLPSLQCDRMEFCSPV